MIFLALFFVVFSKISNPNPQIDCIGLAVNLGGISVLRVLIGGDRCTLECRQERLRLGMAFVDRKATENHVPRYGRLLVEARA